jgi:hypothetical protein
MTRRSIAYLKRFGLVVALIGAMAALQPGNASVATADVSSIVTSGSPDKNALQETGIDALPGSYVAASPKPGSKNSNVGTAADDSVGTTQISPPEPGSKNYQGDAQAAPPSSITAAELAGSGSLLTCSASGNLNWTTTSGIFEVIRQCTLTVPQGGWVFISADGSMAREDGEYEAQFRIGIDNTAGDPNIDRWVNVYNDSGDGTDKSVALSVLREVSPGAHTFYFLGSRYSGAGTVLVYDPTLTVIFVPASHSQVRTCGASGNLNWTTTSSTFEVIRQCALSVPQEGWVFMSTDGSAALSDGEYEAQFRIGIDDTSGDTNIDRWVNVYNDGGDGTDESVALSVLKQVTPGTHSFYFLGSRYSGAGTGLLYDPTLTVIYVPSPGAAAVSCGASGNLNWTTTSNSFEVIRQCTLSVPQEGWAFISADGSTAWQDGEYEARFRIGIDNTGGDANIDRWIDVYTDSGDGTDKSVALSALKHVTAGTHTFYFLGSRPSGAGTLLLYDPTLTVTVPGARLYLPLVIKG